MPENDIKRPAPEAEAALPGDDKRADAPLHRRSHMAITFKRLMSDPKAVVGLVLLVIFILIAIFSDLLITHNPASMSADILAKPFTKGHIFGTDHLGRDLYSRVIVGTRYSITLGLASTIFSMICGIILGSIAGFVGGFVDEFLMRVLDVIQSVPGVLLNMALATAFGMGFFNLICAMGVGGIASMTRLERSCILSVRKLEYIDAASATNCSFFRKLRKHVIPNAFAPMLVSTTMRIGGTIMSAAGLSFLGCGMPVSTPEWGALLSAGRDYIKNSAYLCIIPGLFLVVFVLSINLFGDGLRDALDPKLKK